MNLLEAAKTIFRKQGSKEIQPLTTPWTDSLIPEHILTEYPRPQMVRENYQIYNGYWEYQICPLNKELSAIVASDVPEQYAGKILVPFSPEAPLSGVHRILMPGEALWYHRSIKISELRPQHRLLLHFGAVDERCVVFFNQEPVGLHRGGYLPFTIDITDYIQEGENQLLVCCLDDSDSQSASRGKQKLKRGGMFYTPQSGIWQTVWSEWVPDLYIESLRITPHPDQYTAEIEATVCVSGSSMDLDVLHLTAEIQKPACFERTVSSAGIPFSKDGRIISSEIFDNATFAAFRDSEEKNTSHGVRLTLQGEVNIPQEFLKAWTPEHPWLYPCRFTLSDGNRQLTEDTITSYFAMRSFTLEPDSQGIPRLCLNHVPYFQNGLLDQGYWPDGLYTAPCDEALIYDIQTMKKAGFNMLRKHCKLEPLRWYYHCDRLGMIVWQDMVNGGSDYNMIWLCYLPTLFPFLANRPADAAGPTGRKNLEAREQWREDLKKTIAHLYNCPCIGSWVLFNEGWGQFDTEELTDLLRELDPTRTIDAASGWFDHRGGDMKSVHNYFRKLTCPKDPTGKRALVISEYGGFAHPVKGHTRNQDVYGYRIIKTQEEFRRQFQVQQQRIRQLEKEGLSAAVYTQVSDIEDEVNGLLTYDRKVNKLKP